MLDRYRRHPVVLNPRFKKCHEFFNFISVRRAIYDLAAEVLHDLLENGLVIRRVFSPAGLLERDETRQRVRAFLEKRPQPAPRAAPVPRGRS